ncbi:DUF89 protein CxxC subfamily, partial [hydrothermal vent metagenome]
CLPCFVEQALRAARIATNDEKLIKNVLNEVGCMIQETPMENTPAESGTRVYGKISKITGVADPYREIKQRHIAEAKALLPELETMVAASEDPLLTAVRLAIAGNVIDLGINKTFDLVSDIRKILSQDFALFDYNAFKRELAKAKTILYLGDNAGESVFDKLLIQQFHKPVKYAVRTRPIINDVTMKEALDSGLDEVAELIDSGSPAPGIIMRYATPDFREIYQNAELVISKGQGNYEGLSDEKRTIFFLLKAKCPVIARDIGIKEGDIVLKGINL